MYGVKLMLVLCFVVFAASISEKKMCKKIRQIQKKMSALSKAVGNLKDTCDINEKGMKLGFGGSYGAPTGVPTRGTVVLYDDFKNEGKPLNPNVWDYEVSMFGGYNWEFQVYTNDPLNVFQRGGNLYIKPTLTADKFGESYLTNGIMNVTKIWGLCTNSDNYGCYREGKYGLLPPIMSGKIKSRTTFKYGRVEVKAKIPKGDWIWPAIWLLPKWPEYGAWPASGEIDMMESRGNLEAKDNGYNHGLNEIGSTLHWGPDAAQDRWPWTHGTKDDPNLGWSSDFHLYSLEWTADQIICSVDNKPILTVPTPPEGFWKYGHFSGPDPWTSGGKNTPFDQNLYLMLNVAIGGNNGYFSDGWSYNTPKPWKDTSHTANADFWLGRKNWLPTWNGDDVAMQIDYVKMIQY